MLVVEDNSYCMESFVDMMKSLKVSISTAESGEEAIEIFTKSISEGKAFDIIFMKLIMPVMSGFEAAR